MTGADHPLTPADDDFHQPTDDWWFHETCWFWFYVPERRLGGWLYGWARPTIGVCGGGAYVWDPTTFVHWEAPYVADHHNLRLPEERDLRRFTFPTGLSIEALEPLTRYRLGYTDRDLIDVDLEFAAVMPPWVTGDPPHHLDQLGRVTGTVTLHGEQVDVDCLAMRDRTWAVRSERWRDGGGYGYTTAAASPGHAFLAIADESQARGFLALDGERSALASGSRRVERDPDHGFVTRVVIEATDADGRALEADGRSVSRLCFPVPGVLGVVWSSLVEWTVNGVPAWGDDQEPWPVATWSAFRRRHRPPAAN